MNTRLPSVTALDADPTDIAAQHAAFDACRVLILAYRRNGDHVEWSDIDEAMPHALRAFGLPADHLETEDAEG